MTNAEQRALSERIAILAEQAGLPSELLWIAVCPLCDNWVRYWQTTDCMECTTPWCGGEFQKERMDLTDPANLLPVAKAWIGLQPDDEGWTYQVAWCKGQAVGNLYEVVDQDWGRHYDGADVESEWVALALAFAEALEKGVEK